MIRNKVFCIIFLCLACVSPVHALDFTDLDHLFGSDSLVEVVEEESSSLAEVMLTNETVEIGGKYNFIVDSTWKFEKQGTKHGLANNLAGNLFLDARPDPNFRVFTNVKLEHGKSVHVSEFFSDFNVNQRIFFRGGKQTVNWGVGYFFSPADVINLGRIDPKNPDAQLEGPVALKINMPVNIHNYYLYLLLDNVEKLEEVAVAPKVEFVFGRSEVGLGGYYQKTKSPKIMATISSSVKGINLFGEAVISDGSDKNFVTLGEKTEKNPSGLEVVKKDKLFFKGTLGAQFSRPDVNGRFNLVGAAQYYFNGEGYKDTGILNDPRIISLLKENEISEEDLAEPGRHYLAASLSWNKLLNSNFSLSTLWLGNLENNNGQVTASGSLNTYSGITPRLGVTQTYGEGKSTVVFFNVSLGSGSF